MTDGGGQASDGSWQPDPTGRHEQRWRRNTGEWTHHVWSGGELGSDPFNAPPAPSGKPRRSRGRKLLIAFGIAVALIVALAVIGSFIEPESDTDSDEAVQTTTATQSTATTAAAAATSTAAPTANEPDEVPSDTASAATTTAAAPTSDTTDATQATVEQTSSDSGEASLQLQVAAEHDPGYERDDWGPHNSSTCSGAVGSPDPYTGTAIDTCHVDHVVALDEAHESGCPGSGFLAQV